MSKNSRLVYSTDQGRIKDDQPQEVIPEGDGIIRLRLETKGRKGKGVTTISGLPLAGTELKALAKKLKQVCGTGGSVKEHVIEIQGDHRSLLQGKLEQMGYKVKLAGG
ncbi:stress response translation initiation inhibitor YciH [Gilvimarinus sp. F26214L]|uniref:stress response translation initiation inhibitor YciH n=1 Tax=Gilvimarinus sp. DZF01 TaxID=3461371 RepID=UPI00404542B5